MARTVSAPPVRTILAAAVWLSVAGSAEAALPKPVLVTVDNFNQAETDGAMALFVRDGGFGKFIHRREPTSI